MDPLIAYSIPIKGLHFGIHQFDFQIDRHFFENFDYSPIQEAAIDLKLELDRRPDMYVLLFHLKGTVQTECDRCLAGIDLPIEDTQQLVVKLSADEQIGDDDVIFIHPDTSRFQIAEYIYEYICLAMPMIKRYDCEADDNPKCDQEMLRRLLQQEDTIESKEEEGENPIWDALKKWKNQ
ncbi:MAG TPA: DUF177 domain-containing protein [Saprospiraceae bacterium]|nr:DUF177 domain-containing protein [Saprospiraceae bacterium]HMQ83619.1 DUF177 domain-containing protein [Saprospiraceae bacterium]